MLKEERMELIAPILAWYRTNARILPWRENPTPYGVWVSEIMLQQTRVEVVKPYFNRFMSELPTIYDLANAQEERLLKLWEGLGYYSRVRNMKKTAEIVVAQYGGVLPPNFKQLLTLPGIGTYTAGAIASIAYGIAVAAVDGNVLRVLARVMEDYGDITLGSTKKEKEAWLSEMLVGVNSGSFNQAMMELGATVCVPNGVPKCEICPWNQKCIAHSKGVEMNLPVKTAKKPRKIEKRTVFVVVHEEEVALRQRENKGLLAKMWEFPNVADKLNEKQVYHLLEQWGIEWKTILPLGEAKHIFTHIEWQMTGYLVTAKHDYDLDWVWATAKEREDGFPIPNAFAYYDKKLKGFLQEI